MENEKAIEYFLMERLKIWMNKHSSWTEKLGTKTCSERMLSENDSAKKATDKLSDYRSSALNGDLVSSESFT